MVTRMIDLNCFDSGTKRMNQKLDVMDSDYSDLQRSSYVITQIRRQALTNLLGAEIFRKLMGPEISREPYDENRLTGVMARLSKEGSRRILPRFARIYMGVADVLCNTDRASIPDILNLLDVNLKRTDLQYADAVEYRYLRNRLQASAYCA